MGGPLRNATVAQLGGGGPRCSPPFQNDALARSERGRFVPKHASLVHGPPERVGRVLPESDQRRRVRPSVETGPPRERVMDNPSRYEVRNPEIEAILKTLGEAIRAQIPAGWVFALFIASAGEGGSTFYLSSAERET